MIMMLLTVGKKDIRWVSHYERTGCETTVNMKREQTKNKVQSSFFSYHLNPLVAALPIYVSQ
jgi:hypothetical protein